MRWNIVITTIATLVISPAFAGAPQTVVLDARGEVLYAHVGQLEAGPVLDSIYGAVGRKPIAPSSVAGGSPAARTATAAARP